MSFLNTDVIEHNVAFNKKCSASQLIHKLKMNEMKIAELNIPSVDVFQHLLGTDAYAVQNIHFTNAFNEAKFNHIWGKLKSVFPVLSSVLIYNEKEIKYHFTNPYNIYTYSNSIEDVICSDITDLSLEEQLSFKERLSAYLVSKNETTSKYGARMVVLINGEESFELMFRYHCSLFDPINIRDFCKLIRSLYTGWMGELDAVRKSYGHYIKQYCGHIHSLDLDTIISDYELKLFVLNSKHLPKQDLGNDLCEISETLLVEDMGECERINYANNIFRRFYTNYFETKYIVFNLIHDGRGFSVNDVDYSIGYYFDFIPIYVNDDNDFLKNIEHKKNMAFKQNIRFQVLAEHNSTHPVFSRMNRCSVNMFYSKDPEPNFKFWPKKGQLNALFYYSDNQLVIRIECPKHGMNRAQNVLKNL